MEYVLHTENLSKHYRHFKALDGLNMHVEKGSIYGFVGRNGSGKTTLIRLICGLQKPSAGGFCLYGAKNTEKGILRARRRLGAVVETPSVFMHMTAEENLREQYRVLGRPSFDGIKELLELVGLSDSGKKKAKNFSLGMRQRLGIAVALCGDPDFLVLDEPINALDPQGIVEIRELILKLNRERNITVLLSSHILDELSRLATHFGFIEGGKIIKEISAQDLNSVCRKCLHIQVSDIHTLTRVLEIRKLEYALTSENEADIFGECGVTELTLALADEHCEVLTLSEQDENLESYYINLIGGGKHE